MTLHVRRISVSCFIWCGSGCNQMWWHLRQLKASEFSFVFGEALFVVGLSHQQLSG